MSGVTILNVKEAFLPAVYEYQGIIIPILIILAVMSLVCVFIFINHEIVAYIFSGVTVLSVLFAFIFACAQPIQYDVILDNSVNYNEFIEKYDVIEVNGKIYTVQLKDQ
jgi:hypothetical protein